MRGKSGGVVARRSAWGSSLPAPGRFGSFSLAEAAFYSRWRLRNAAARRPGPRMQSSRSKIEPQTAYGAFISMNHVKTTLRIP
jgi:hypothetical protein